MSTTTSTPDAQDSTGPDVDAVDAPQEDAHTADTQDEATDDVDPAELLARLVAAEEKAKKAQASDKTLRQRLREAQQQAEENARDAAQLRALADASKTDAQREAEARDARIAALEKQLADAETARQRAAIQAKYGLDDDEADDLLDGTDVERMERRAARHAEAKKAAADRTRRAALTVPAEGRSTPQPTGDPLRAFARSVFGG